MPDTLPSRDALPNPDELTRRLAHCIGIWETNRGGSEPRPQESRLDTVCGVRASMATIEQATMPYAAEAFRRFPALRAAADPPLTEREIAAAEACCKAVRDIVAEVDAALAQGQSPKDFSAARDKALKAARLARGDLTVLFAAAALKQTVVALNARVSAGELNLDQAVAQVPEGERMKLGPASLKAYLRRTANWGENRAAWQRKAVARLPGKVGTRMEAVATGEGGTALAFPMIAERVRAAQATMPPPDEQQLVIGVAQANNPNEPGYGDNVFKIYRRLYMSEQTGFFGSLVELTEELAGRLSSVLTREEARRLHDLIGKRLGIGP